MKNQGAVLPLHYRKKKSGCLFVVLIAIVLVLAFKFGLSVMNNITKKSFLLFIPLLPVRPLL